MTRDELIAALEAATGPDYDLDLSIAEWCFRNGAIGGINYDPSLWMFRHERVFTESIDAALTLVPEGYWWTCGACKRECHASVGAEGIDTNQHAEGFGATAAIALCIAALKAGAAPCNT